MDSKYTTLHFEMFKLFNEIAPRSQTCNSPTSDAVKAAAYTLSILPLIAIYPFFQKYFVTGLTVRGVKD